MVKFIDDEKEKVWGRVDLQDTANRPLHLLSNQRPAKKPREAKPSQTKRQTPHGANKTHLARQWLSLWHS